MKLHPPLTKKKLTLTSPQLLIILRSTPPPPHSLPPPRIVSLIPNLCVGCLPQAQKVLQMTLQRMSSLHRNHFTLILIMKLCVVSTRVIKFFIFQNIPGSIFTCVAENLFSKISLTSAYPETMLFQIHFQLVVCKRFHICFIFQGIFDGRAFLFLTLFFAFASKNSRCST